jgi:hypothetical protein
MLVSAASGKFSPFTEIIGLARTKKELLKGKRRKKEATYELTSQYSFKDNVRIPPTNLSYIWFRQGLGWPCSHWKTGNFGN